MIIPLCETDVNDTSIIRDIGSTSLALRLCELGFSLGTEVKTLLKSVGNNCAAYVVKGTLLALRNEDARKINVFIRK